MDLQASLQESSNEQQCPPGTHTYLEVPIGTSVQEQRGMDRDDCSWVDDNSCKIACDIIITEGDVALLWMDLQASLQESPNKKQFALYTDGSPLVLACKSSAVHTETTVVCSRIKLL